MGKHFRQDSGLYNFSYEKYSEKLFTQMYGT